MTGRLLPAKAPYRKESVYRTDKFPLPYLLRPQGSWPNPKTPYIHLQSRPQTHDQYPCSLEPVDFALQHIDMESKYTEEGAGDARTREPGDNEHLCRLCPVGKESPDEGATSSRFIAASDVLALR